jgi:subtilisin family serine protease
VTATDEDDKLFHAAVRGKHIAVAAPGVDLWLPSVQGTYQEISGTSFSAAEVSGTVALLLERRPDLDPESVMTTARDLGPRGIDPQFGAGLVDAYKALMALDITAAAR